MEAVQISNKYKPLYTSDKRYFLVTGGRGSLKSTTVHDYICRLTYEPGHGVLFTRYTMASAKLSIIPEFEETLARNGSRNDFYITANKIVNLRTQSFIIFSGIKTSSGDQTANLKSLAGITTWVIEEGEDFIDEKAFDRIDDSIRSTMHQNRVIWIQNPSTREHFIYKRWIEGHSQKTDCEGYKVTVSNHPDVEHIHTSYHIAARFGYLSPSFVRKAEMARDQNEEWYIHNYMGGWLEKAEGVIFDNWTEGFFDESLPFVYGMDFGYVNDETTLVKVAVDSKSKTLYLHELAYNKAQSTQQICDMLEVMVEGNDLIIADCAEPRLIDELAQAQFNVVPCVKGQDSVRLGITNMQAHKMVITRESENLKKELNHYIWNPKGKSNVPIDKYNHLIDAARYAFGELTNFSDFFIG